MPTALDIAKRTQAQIDKRRAGQPSQLPLWNDRSRGLPNAFARSALFTCGGRSDQREYFEQHHIASVAGFKILYTGKELRQDDEDVFLQITHLARLSPLGEHVEFTAHAMLTALGWDRCSKSYDRLKTCINRLSTTTVIVEFDNGSEGYGGSLVRQFAWKTKEVGNLRRWRVWLEKPILALFGHDTYTQLDWEERLALRPLAKWLHSFYFTHRDPIGYKVETLKNLCGSDVARLYHFRTRLKLALEELVAVGFLAEWAIKNDVVLVKRSPRRLAAG